MYESNVCRSSRFSGSEMRRVTDLSDLGAQRSAVAKVFLHIEVNSVGIRGTVEASVTTNDHVTRQSHGRCGRRGNGRRRTKTKIRSGARRRDTKEAHRD